MLDVARTQGYNPSDMPTQTTKDGLADFVHVAFGSKEVGLALAENAKELVEFSQALDSMGFTRAEDVSGLTERPKVYLVLGKDMEKGVYDFAVQYPTGQVEMFDGDAMRSRVMTPDYRNTAVILLASKKDIAASRARGFDILAVAGPAYRS